MQTGAAKPWWSVFRKKNIMQGLFEWKWGFSFKSLICGRKKKDGLQCEKSKWFLVVNIRDVSRSPMSDHRYPPPLRHVARLEATDPWLQTAQHFLGWRTDYQFGHWCIHQSLISTTIVTPSPLTPASSRATAPPWQIVVRLLAPKLDKWSRGGGH